MMAVAGGDASDRELSLAEAIGNACTDAQVVLVIIVTVAVRGKEVIRLNRPQAPAAMQPVVEASADNAGKGKR
jgi:hypothetical protein